LKPGSVEWGYLTEKARPITTRNTARNRKGARIWANQILTENLLIAGVHFGIFNRVNIGK
jgi:hypothetical protein